MGIFSRIAMLFRVRANAALDKAEDPGQTMDYSYGKQLEQLQEMKRSVADVVTAKKRLELQQSQMLDKANQRGQQARQALTVNREDLARMALQEKETLLIQVNSFEQQIAQLHTQEEKLLGMQRQLTTRVETFRTQKEMVKAQYNAAQAQVRINETVTGISAEMGDMAQAMQRAQDKVLSMQARADAMETLIDEDHFSMQALPAGGGSELDRELQKISAEQSVDDQLQALKQQMQLGGPQTSQKHIEGPTS